MSRLTALVVSRYRAFAGTETLPLRPLTLLYGRNNSGKSALARAFALLGASLDPNARDALVVPPELGRDGTFADLAWKGDAGDHSFDLGLRWDDGDLREARYTLDRGAGRSSYVKELVLRDAKGDVLWAGLAPPGRPLRTQGDQVGAEVKMLGLIPHEPELPLLGELATRLTALRGRVRWLDGVRARARRIIQRTGIAPKDVGPDGANAPDFLVEQPDLVSDVARFYAELDPPRELEVKEELDVGHRLRLSPAGRASFRIDLADTGEGMAQVLPVLVGASLAAKDGAAGLLAVEEPESHLHPDAEYILARYLCGVAAGPNAPTLVVETHSRVFLLGVQLAIAEGRLRPEDVSLAWIDQDTLGRSTITPVELAPSGHPSAGWPVTALGEDLRLATMLARLDLERRS